MFTREEASSFIAAEKLMQKFTDATLGNHYASAMYKLKAVLRSDDKDWVSSIESSVLMQSGEKLFNDKSPNTLATLFESIAEKTQVILSYEAIQSDGITVRHIEPVGVFHENNNWYVFGYCHLRKEYRQFRADRLHGIQKTAIPFSLEHDALETYLDKNKNVPTTKVRILVDKKIAKYLAYEQKYHGFVSEKKIDDKTEMTFMTRDIENGFARWYMMYGDYATILEPERLKTRILELLEINRQRIL
jgi:predicted DNA-binding transcriptional regulator YafY